MRTCIHCERTDAEFAKVRRYTETGRIWKTLNVCEQCYRDMVNTAAYAWRESNKARVKEIYAKYYRKHRERVIKEKTRLNRKRRLKRQWSDEFCYS